MTLNCFSFIAYMVLFWNMASYVADYRKPPFPYAVATAIIIVGSAAL